MIREGLNFGPAFRSITGFSVDRMRKLKHCLSRAPLLQDTPNENYPIHPTTIDAMLQTAIVAVSAGEPETLRAIVPTKIGSATFLIGSRRADESAHISSSATAVGFGASLLDAELRTELGHLVVQLQDVRAAPYQAATRLDMGGEQRHPMLRVIWKPDAAPGILDSSGLARYLDTFSLGPTSDIVDEGLQKLLGIVHLLSHKNPYLRILEIGDGVSDISKTALGLLHSSSSFPRLLSYHVGAFTESGQLRVSDIDMKTGEATSQAEEDADTSYDLVLCSSNRSARGYLEKVFGSVKDLIAPRGALLAIQDEHRAWIDFQQSQLAPIFYPLADGQRSVLLAQSTRDDRANKSFRGELVYVIYRERGALLEAVIRESQGLSGNKPRIMGLEGLKSGSIAPRSIVISLVELEGPVLAKSTDAEMNAIKELTDNASVLVWVTGSGLIAGGAPTKGLVSGLSRTVMVEQPALKFITFDVDDCQSDVEQTSRNIMHVLARSGVETEDREFAQRGGVVHVSRYVPDDRLNESFRQKQGLQTQRLALAKAKPAQLAIGMAGQLDSLFFKQLPASIESQVLGPSHVEVEVQTVGLNAKDYFAVMGRVDTRDATCTLEHCGVVLRTGCSVDSLKPGDRIVVMAPGKFKTTEVVPQWACQRLEDGEDAAVMCTLPLVYSTALYALQNRANLQPGESVLVHAGTSAVGMAAIHIAHRLGAGRIYTTVSNAEKKAYLVENLGVAPANIFNSRDITFVEGIREMTGGRGVDVVLNSLTGELLHASWACCGEFGRFVEIGKRDLTDAGCLGMGQFLRSATFTAFDLTDLYYSRNPAHNRTWASLLQQVVRMYRAGELREFPTQVFDVEDTTDAFRRAGSSSKIGKVREPICRPLSESAIREDFPYGVATNRLS